MATPTWQTINATQNTESVDFTVNELTEIEIDTGIENAPTLSCLVRAVNPEDAQTTLVLFAAGRLKGKPITPTRYEYWSHASKIPNCNIIFVSDPALKTPGIRGITVGLHKDFDGIEVIYSGIKKILELLNAEPRNLNFSGFSQGGYFALQLGSFFEHSRILVFNPTFYSLHPIIPEASQIIEEALNNEYTIEEYTALYPVQVSAWERMRYNRRIPQMEIYTNRKDFVRLLTLEIIEKVMQADEKDFSEIGRAEIKTTSTHLFHSPLPIEEWLKAINKFVATASKSTVQSETKTK